MDTELEPFRKHFTLVLRLLLMRWSPWLGGDKVLALDIGFDSFNTEICVSLLTDREPRAAKNGVSPLHELWDVDSWRLNGINKTATHCFPDAADLVKLMETRARVDVTTDAELLRFNERLKRFFFEVATSDAVINEVRRFPFSSAPIQVRVHWFFEQSPPLQHQVHQVAI